MLVYETVVQPTLLHVCQQKMKSECRMGLQERRRNEEILDEARVEPIAMVMRRLEWFEHVTNER